MQTYEFRNCKGCGRASGAPRYRIAHDTTIYVCSTCGLHYIDHLDDLARLTGQDAGPEARARQARYIESVLESNGARFRAQVDLVAAYKPLRGARCLDVGAGGGLFLHLLRERGAEVHGIEPDPLNAAYAEARYGVRLSPETLEARQDAGSFDVITLWDVLEHVKFPLQTLAAAVALLRPAGILCLDTPIRDGALHRLGVLSYRLSGGRARQLLATQYSNTSFGHKQIFSTPGLRAVIHGQGLEVLLLHRVHELSFPYAVYLRRLLRSQLGARLATPLAAAFFTLFRVRNKAVLVATKP